MAKLFSRPYTPRDLDAVLALLSAWRTAEPFDRLGAYPTVRRLDLLLTSRLWEPEHDARIWEDATGQPIGFAALWSRKREDAWRAMEGPFVHPSLQGAENVLLEDATAAWAKHRVDELVRQSGEPAVLTSMVRQNDAAGHAALERWGFALHAAAANVYWERALDDVPAPTPPSGSAVRLLAGEQELDAYAALYGFAAVEYAHRLALLRDPGYAHLVIAAPDGALVAYCEVSICRREWIPGAPRIGWIEYVGTREDCQQRGLGRAVLLAGLAQLREWGAERAMLITMPANAPANALYHATGFTRAAYEDVYQWRSAEAPLMPE